MEEALIRELKLRQGAKTQTEFASDLRIRQAWLSKLYNRPAEYRMGLDLGRRIAELYPELVFDVAKCLLFPTPTQTTQERQPGCRAKSA